MGSIPGLECCITPALHSLLCPAVTGTLKLAGTVLPFACLLCLTLCLNVLLPCNDVQLLVCYRWVPLLFAVAAVIIGTGHTVLDMVMIHWQVCAASRANLLTITHIQQYCLSSLRVS